MALKNYWKVSMQALVMRASVLELISPRQKRTFFQRLNARGYRQKEPNELPMETPRIVHSTLAVHSKRHHYTAEQLSEIALLDPAEFQRAYGHSWRAERQLRVVN